MFSGANMKNITISMDEDLAQRTRVAAAEAGLSVSRFLADAAREKIQSAKKESEDDRRNAQLEALERIFAGPKWSISEDGRMPSAEERNARR